LIYIMGELIKGKWTGWKIESKKIYRGAGFIYWYFWGDRPFDIREVRELVGMKKREYAMDKNYYKKPCLNNEKIMIQLEEMTDGKDFTAIINEIEQKRSRIDKAGIHF